MGGAVSSGKNNDELVDNLIESGYIRSKNVEKVFRAVDRADYFLSSHRTDAYKDYAWKHGNIHLSAPCVYSEVMEGLSLKPGLSFLNFGSGTGYLSTMAGLILTQNGINHGVELHKDCVKYSYDRLEEFKAKSLALDEFDFCEPRFIQGNCLNIIPSRRYDRVYCGATCPETHEVFVKQFVEVGGILVMPFKDHLLRIERTEENVWVRKTMLPVSFATLVVPFPEERETLVHLPACEPLRLQELCRGRIRSSLRRNIWHEHADLECEKPIIIESQKVTSSSNRTHRRYVIPIFEDSDEGLTDEDDDSHTGRTSLFLNVNAHPGEAISTSLQLVAAVVQPNRDEIRADSENGSNRNPERSNLQSNIESVHLNIDNSERKNSNEEERFQSSETHSRSSISDVSSSSDSACDNTEGYTARNNENEKSSGGDSGEKDVSFFKSYSIICDGDNEQNQEYSVMQRKKMVKRDKIDSGFGEDIGAVDGDCSSSSNTQPSKSDVMETMDFQSSDAFHDNDSSPVHEPVCIQEQRRNRNAELNMGHYVDSIAFTSHMVERIHQLPLPHELKLYMNYNRKL